MPKSKYSAGLEGLRFGRWTVVTFSHVRLEPRRDTVKDRSLYYWLCLCDCGKTKAVDARLLFRGKSTSCGCYNREMTRRTHTRHGQLIGLHGKVMPPEYRSWDHMIQRCTNPGANKYWHRYGGRGITVCAGFRDYQTFFRALGHKPTLRHSIDRRNNNGHYSCGECAQCKTHQWPMNLRWATPREQSNNRG